MAIPLLEAAVEEADAKLAELTAVREAAKPPDRLLREAERGLARAEHSRVVHLGFLEKAEARIQAAKIEAEAAKAWIAKRDLEAGDAKRRIQAATSRLGSPAGPAAAAPDQAATRTAAPLQQPTRPAPDVRAVRGGFRWR